MQYGVLGRTGFKVSRLGLGGAQFGDIYGELRQEDANRLVKKAFELGINFIDTAPLYGYGESERRLGIALEGVNRESYVLSTKTGLPGKPYGYEATMTSVEESLQRLRAGYADLVQVHDVEQMEFDRIMNETVPALERLKQEGRIRAIGVSTKYLELLMRYMNTEKFDTIQFYNRHVLIDYTARDEVLPLAESMNLGVINGSSMAMGILADNPAEWLNKDTVARAQARMEQIEFLRGGGGAGSLVEPALRFSFSNPGIHSTLTGASSVEQLIQNAAYCDGRGLSEQDESRLLSLFSGQELFK